jgi:RNA polymerase sigma-70 factor (ECF subfamily)
MDPLEIKELYEKYGFLMYGRCIRILSSADEAKDAFHDIFLKFIKKYPEFKNAQHIVPWIYTVAKNHCFNILRQKKKFIQEIDWETMQSACDINRITEFREILSKTLSTQSKKVRDAVYYTYIEQLNQEEIHALTGQSPATIRRNLKLFKDRLKPLREKLGL